ncbi:MAG: hypothetical protein ACK4UL_11070 [Novosphingobium meiothermophilum]|uniref:hypothetical protein n=1 Tax=Novosphingobium TaxID=165696 RepID=UPI000D6E036B|nr:MULTISPECIES: hypothetical protein [Novosphingobium]
MTSLLACAAAMTVMAPAALAQRAGGHGGGGMSSGTMQMPSQGRTGDMDRMRDQDRMQDRDRLHDRDATRDRDRDRTRDRDQLQDRDRLQISRNIEGQLSGWQMLTEQERQQFHQRMRNATTEQERQRVRAENQEMIRERARNFGVDAPFGPERAGSGQRDGYYLAQALTEQERLQFHQRMRNATTEQERARIRTEMQTMARERARDMGVDVPDWYGRGQP